MRDVFVHPRALRERATSARGTRVWAFAHVLPGARIGGDCNICDHVFVENDVVVGDRVTVKCGVQLWDGVARRGRRVHRPERHVHQRPVPAQPPVARPSHPRTIVRRGASIGANATILPGRRDRRGAMVGAGAVVTRDRCRRTRSWSATRRASSATPGSRSDEPTARAHCRRRRARRAATSASPASRCTGSPMHGHARQPDRRRVRAPTAAVPAATLLPGLRRAERRGARRARAPRVPAVPGLRQRQRARSSSTTASGRARSCSTPDARASTCRRASGRSSTTTRATRSCSCFASHPYDAADYIRDYDEFLAERLGEPRDHAAGPDE